MFSLDVAETSELQYQQAGVEGPSVLDMEYCCLHLRKWNLTVGGAAGHGY